MKLISSNIIQSIIAKFGYKITNLAEDRLDNDVIFSKIFSECSQYTYTPIERMYSLYSAVKYIVSGKIPGDFVECGVWRGGNCMLIAKTLLALGEKKRKIYLYDTFEGMTEPTSDDYHVNETETTLNIWKQNQKSGFNDWCYASLEDVRSNMKATNYPFNNFVFIKGKVEDTLPQYRPKKISLLRLDTDWYESTNQELIHLYPRLSTHGVLIIDDYGHWEGARKAVDEYISKHKVPILLNRVDYTCRLGIKIATT